MVLFKVHKNPDQKVCRLLPVSTSSDAETVERSDESVRLFLSANNPVETTPDQSNTSEVSFLVLHAAQKHAWPGLDILLWQLFTSCL